MKPASLFVAALCLASLGIGAAYGPAVHAAQADSGALPSGDEVAQRINARDDGESVSRRIVMELTDKSGKKRVRETRSYRKYVDGDRKIVIVYDEPTNLRGTAFLTFDYADSEAEDDQWLYLPALRKSRRIAGAERGDSFMGTDFTYDDMKQETKVSLADYTRRTLSMTETDGVPIYEVEAIPVSEDVASALGYSRVVSQVDGGIWMIRSSRFWDLQGNLLKTVTFEDIREVDGIWTPHRLSVENHKTGHHTVFVVSEVDYDVDLVDRIFTREAMSRGF